MANTASLDAPHGGGQEQPQVGWLPGSSSASVRSDEAAGASAAAGGVTNLDSSTTLLRWSSCNQAAVDDARALETAGGASQIVHDAAAADAAGTGAARDADGGGQAQQARGVAQAVSAPAGGLADQDEQLRELLGGCSCCVVAR